MSKGPAGTFGESVGGRHGDGTGMGGLERTLRMYRSGDNSRWMEKPAGQL